MYQFLDSNFKVFLGLSPEKLFSKNVLNCDYRLVIFRKPFLFTILLNNLNKNSTWQCILLNILSNFSMNEMVNKKGLSENDWSVAVSTGSLLFYKYFRIHLWNGWPIHTVSYDEFLFGFIVHEVFIMIFFDILPEIVIKFLRIAFRYFRSKWKVLDSNYSPEQV